MSTSKEKTSTKDPETVFEKIAFYLVWVGIILFVAAISNFFGWSANALEYYYNKDFNFVNTGFFSQVGHTYGKFLIFLFRTVLSISTIQFIILIPLCFLAAFLIARSANDSKVSKPKKIIITSFCLMFLVAVIPLSCNNNDGNVAKENEAKLTQEQIDNFESKLTEEGYFWKSGISEFLFKNDGTVTSLTHGYGNPSVELGKWAFDKTTAVLQIAWAKSSQTSAKVYEVKNDWSVVYTTDKIYNYGNYGIERMKLLDNRFNQ